MYGKLSIIDHCLPITGNSVVNVEDDGSDEWTVASTAYDEGVKYLLAGHDWKFSTAIVTPGRVGDSPDDAFTDAYAKPAGALGIVWVKVDGFETDWRVVGNQILVNAASGVKVKYVLQPEPEAWPPLFVAALICLVKAGIYEGLNEDPAEAKGLRAEAQAKLALARSRSDQEGSSRAVFRSRILARRRGAVTGLGR